MRYAAALMLATGLVLSGCTSSSPDGALAGATAGTPSQTAQKLVPPDPGICPESQVNAAGYHDRSATQMWQDRKDVRAVFLCRVSDRRVAGDGRWRYLVVDRVTSPVDKLLLAYTRPDESGTGGTHVCTTEGQPPLVLWLQTDDGAAAVEPPVDTCGKPTDQAKHHYRLIETVPVRATKVERIQTQLSIDTGCYDTWDARNIGVFPPRSPRPAKQPLRAWGGRPVCEYEIPKGRPWKHGDLRSGRTLSAKETAELRTALSRAPADRSCPAVTPRRFVVVHGWDNWLAVSPGGCVWQPGLSHDRFGVWRAGPELFERLTS